MLIVILMIIADCELSLIVMLVICCLFCGCELAVDLLGFSLVLIVLY